jgi:AraC family transcriptional regulator
MKAESICTFNKKCGAGKIPVLLRTYPISKPAIRHRRRKSSEHKLKESIEYINENIDKPLTLTEVSRAAGISPFHFSRLFKQSNGLAPHQYIIKGKIERAKNLLAETDLPISSIAYGIGFANQSHFTTVFSKLVGVTSKAYRKMMTNGL